MRHRNKWVTATAAIGLAVGFVALPASAGTVLTNSGFEANDGNLLDNDPPTGQIDWNSFKPVTWTGTAPTRVAEKTESGGYEFNGKEDWVVSNADSGFAGGVKQDLECAGLVTQKANNKEDLERIYLAHKTIDVGGEDHVFLNLAWARIPQNSTTASSNVAFEFNQSDVPCGPNSPLVERSTANGGDMLVLYDFAGGTADPTIKLSRWVDSGACEISSNSPPCWSTATTLTGSGIAEAKVNIASVGPVLDEIAPGGSQTQGLVEFGEAGIDLTDAGVFPSEPTECISFGQAFGVARTSGNSGTAQMKDIVGPTPVNISNCGSIEIKKETDPDEADDSTSFGFTSDIPEYEAFSLTDDDSTGAVSVFTGDYTVTEDDLTGTNYALTDITCSGGSTTVDLDNRKVDITVDADDVVECTFTNTLQTGSILVLKVDENGDPLDGAAFELDPDTETADDETAMTDYGDGVFCTDGLFLGTEWTVHETQAPPGYNAGADAVVTVTSQDDCSTRTAAEELDPDATITNSPAPGTINVSKTDDDDPANPLEGAEFTLYVDDNEDGAWDDATETTIQDGPTATNASGELTFSDVPLGFYCVVETTTPTGYSTADPQCVEVGLGSSEGTGQTIDLDFVDPRLHKVIVITCHEGTNDLVASDVDKTTAPTGSLTTLDEGATLPDGVSEADLCSLGGFGGLEHGDVDLSVDVGSGHTP
jgi:hypothetical protein